jgi:Tfp pilus assembly protein FimT
MKIIKSMLLAVAAWGGLFTMADPAFSQTWTQTSAPSNYWVSIASSADGTKLAAVASPGPANPGPIYVSTNSGATWTQASAPTNYYWYAVASSADGSKLVAVAPFDTSVAPFDTSNNLTGRIYTSTNFGMTWASNNAPGFFWSSVASSADGNKLVAAVWYGPVCTSTNSGATWMQTSAPTNGSWDNVASSADGTRLVIVASSGIYCSTNSGVTWTQMNPPQQGWPVVGASQMVSLSADGTKMAVAVSEDHQGNPGMIYTSVDLGNTWTACAPNNYWTSVVLSADGSKLIAIPYFSFGPSPIYTSTNSGATWTTNSAVGAWNCVASSADGCKLVAGGGGYFRGPIDISYSTPAPQLNLAPSGGNLTVSWIVPSTDFRLQQNVDLTTTNWTDVTNPPVLNLTNLQNEVTFPLTGSNAFYRLKTP